MREKELCGPDRSALENAETHFSLGEKPFSRLSSCAACLPRQLIYNFYPRLFTMRRLAAARSALTRQICVFISNLNEISEKFQICGCRFFRLQLISTRTKLQIKLPFKYMLSKVKL